MNKKMIIILAIATVALLGIGVYAYRDQLFPKATTQTNNSSLNKANTASTTYEEYATMKGETYDRNFIANMIAHHEGAVAMAKLALANAKHQELKDMAQNIVSDQQKEMSQMASWQKQWDYPSTSSDNMMDHSAMGMMSEMAGMETSLDGKTGDAFDKAFIAQMSLHHQSAIDMAAPGMENAKHQEVKDLTAAIVTAQSREIAQMKQWQQDWGYNS